MNIKNILIKFRYGEEIICEAQDMGSEYFVKHAASLIPTENQSWHLVTWMPYSNVRNGIKIKKEDILFVADLEDDMKTYYDKWKNILSGKKVEL